MMMMMMMMIMMMMMPMMMTLIPTITLTLTTSITITIIINIIIIQQPVDTLGVWVCSLLSDKFVGWRNWSKDIFGPSPCLIYWPFCIENICFIKNQCWDISL